MSKELLKVKLQSPAKVSTTITDTLRLINFGTSTLVWSEFPSSDGAVAGQVFLVIIQFESETDSHNCCLKYNREAMREANTAPSSYRTGQDRNEDAVFQKQVSLQRVTD